MSLYLRLSLSCNFVSDGVSTHPEIPTKRVVTFDLEIFCPPKNHRFKAVAFLYMNSIKAELGSERTLGGLLQS